MTHPCLGSYSVHPREPCSRCALRGPCATQSSDPDDFGILHRPRYSRPAETYAVSTSSFHPEVANAFHRLMSAAKLSRKGGKHDSMYYVGRTALGHLMEARPQRLVVFLEKCPSRAVEATEAYRSLIIPADVFDHPRGSLIVSPDPVVLVQLMVGVAAMHHLDVGS